MTFIGKNLTLSGAAVAAALLLAPGSGMTTTLDTAFASALASQAGDAAADAVILAKDKGPGDFKCCGNGGGGGIPPGPGDFKPGGGGGGGGGKGGKGGGSHHHHHHWGPAIGGGIVLGLGYCTVQSNRCAEEYGYDTGRYWRCMRRAGCSD